MEINTDAYQQKNEQIHCEIVYCKEKKQSTSLNAKKEKNLEDILLGKRNQTPKSTYYMILFL